MQNASIITIDKVTKRFPIGGRQFTALDRISLTFRKADFAGLVGPSGSGKTTLLNIIGTLDMPSEGAAQILGKSVAVLTHRQAAHLRNRYLGFIFQSYNLLPVYTVYENVEYPLLLLKKGAQERRRAVMEILDFVGLSDRVDSKPAQLSGGECQRVSIARAMVKNPAVVLADEPTANLDAKNSHHILKTMLKLNREFGTTFLFATHDDKVIGYLKRKIMLEDGKVVGDERYDHT
jgi:putative ABC transport system ATP-binding protein